MHVVSSSILDTFIFDAIPHSFISTPFFTHMIGILILDLRGIIINGYSVVALDAWHLYLEIPISI